MPFPPHILNREDFAQFTLTQIMAGDTNAGKRLNAVWEVSTDTRYFELQRRIVGRYVTDKKFADLDEAIAAYNDFKEL